MFRKLFVMVAFSLCAVTSFASQTVIQTDGLSDAQVAELKAQAAKVIAETARQASTPTVENASATMTLAATWGTQAAAAAEGFAKAISIAARELGVTVNDFLHTDAGKLTAILIIWKVAGATVVKMLYGTLFITVGLIIVRTIYVRLFTSGYEKVAYSRFFGMFKGEKMVRVKKSFSDLNNDGEWLAFWLMLIVSMGSMLIGAFIIL